MREKIRLFVNADLGPGQDVVLSRAQAHYLFGVMRQAVGAHVALFNGRDGEWRARIDRAGKRDGLVHCVEHAAAFVAPPDLWLLFAPVKKARTDFIVEKAVELGVARICPVLTEFTNSERVRQDRLQAHAVEAAEQCGATYVPQVAEAAKLSDVLSAWQAERNIMFCDEARAGEGAQISSAMNEPAAILVGPEGGFSASERARFAGMEYCHPVSLGPRILRADTAAVAALTLWQAALGDWR